MNILVTGAAGFIGASVVGRLIDEGHSVTGIDSINGYYDRTLKLDRLKRLGIPSNEIEWHRPVRSLSFGDFTFIKLDLTEIGNLDRIFYNYGFDTVIHLAGQPGVRHSISHPREYLKNNIDVFVNILEECREHSIRHLVFASSSSVYGLNGKVPFSENDATDHPASIYAATKKSNELMAHTYSHLYGLPVTGLRFFTVYGPWGRPDMSPHLFISAIMKGEPIKVFNNGDMLRDFTFIDDIVESITRIVGLPPGSTKGSPFPQTEAPYRIYNVGNQHPVRLIDYIRCIEDTVGEKAVKEFLPMQPGDLYQTFSDTTALYEATGFLPSTPLGEGIKKTVEWFKDYYNKLNQRNDEKISH